MNLIRGDDAPNFIRININDDVNIGVQQLIVKIGTICKVIDNPVSPVYISLTSEETTQLFGVTQCNIAIIDKNGNKTTAQTGFVIETNKETVTCRH